MFDKDQTTGNSNDDNILVGEQVYSTNPAGQPLTDWWYTGGTAKAATRGITCPSTTGGSGSDCHGTLAQWAAALTTAKVYRRRLLDRQRRPGRRGPARRQPRSELVCLHRRTQGCGHVKAKAAKSAVKTGSKIKVTGTAKPVGPNAKVQLQVKKNGKWKTKAEKALAADGSYKLKTNAPGKPGKVKLRVLVTGDQLNGSRQERQGRGHRQVGPTQPESSRACHHDVVPGGRARPARLGEGREVSGFAGQHVLDA